MDIKKLFINMGILGLFVFGFMAFIIITQTENSVEVPITNNTLINETYGDLSDDLSSTQSQTQTASNVFSNATPPTSQLGELNVRSIIGTTRVAKRIIIGLWNIFIRLPMVVLGISPIVAGLISSIILILVIIGIWAIYKGAISS